MVWKLEMSNLDAGGGKGPPDIEPCAGYVVVFGVWDEDKAGRGDGEQGQTFNAQVARLPNSVRG